MSQVKVSGNASGTGVFEIAAPNSNTNYTLTLPQATTTLVGTDATQTLTNKTINGGAITSGTAVASTSGTSIDFTGIPSWVKRITVMFNGVSTNSTSPPQIQIGSGSVTTTGYGCTNSVTVNGAVAAANFTSGFGIGVNTSNWAGTSVVQGAVTLFLLSGNIWACAGSLGSSAGVAIYNTAGSVTLSGTLDRVRITTVNGTDTFDAGSINILYE